MTIQTNNDPAVAEEVAGIKNALDALLTVATDKALVRRFAPSRPDKGPLPLNFGELMKAVDASQAARATNELIRNPIGEAVRSAVVVLGQRLHEIGGMGLMTEVLDDTAEADPPNRSLREAIMDHRWNGIGCSVRSQGWRS